MAAVMVKPQRILVAGMPRSGSTWLYNAARLVLSRRGEVYGCWVDDYRPDHAAACHLIKLHSFDPGLAGDAGAVLTSRRHLCGIARSLIRMGWARGEDHLIARLRKAIQDDARWRPLACYDLRYEAGVRSAAAVRAMARSLAVELLPGEAEAIVEEIDALRAGPAGAAFDKVSLLHGDHVSGGEGAAADLDPVLAARIEREFAPWLAEQGYA